MTYDTSLLTRGIFPTSYKALLLAIGVPEDSIKEVTETMYTTYITGIAALARRYISLVSTPAETTQAVTPAATLSSVEHLHPLLALSPEELKTTYKRHTNLKHVRKTLRTLALRVQSTSDTVTCMGVCRGPELDPSCPRTKDEKPGICTAKCGHGLGTSTALPCVECGGCTQALDRIPVRGTGGVSLRQLLNAHCTCLTYTHDANARMSTTDPSESMLSRLRTDDPPGYMRLSKLHPNMALNTPDITAAFTQRAHSSHPVHHRTPPPLPSQSLEEEKRQHSPTPPSLTVALAPHYQVHSKRTVIPQLVTKNFHNQDWHHTAITPVTAHTALRERDVPYLQAALLQASHFDLRVSFSARFGGGLGVFSDRHIPPHQHLGTLGGTINLHPADTTLQVLLPHSPDRKYTLPPPWKGQVLGTNICHVTYVNHSITPNAILTLLPTTPILCLRALHYIPPQEEITIDYTGWLPVPASHPQYTSLATHLDKYVLQHASFQPPFTTTPPVGTPQGPLGPHLTTNNPPLSLPPPLPRGRQ